MIRKFVASGVLVLVMTIPVAAADFSDQARDLAGGGNRLSLIAGCIANLTASLRGPNETAQTRNATELRLDELQHLFNDEADRENLPANVAADLLAIKFLPIETTSLTLTPPGTVVVDPCAGI